MDLGFEKIVKSSFHFLQSEYHFSCVESGPWCVRYESSKVFVVVVFDGMRSYELGCSIGHIDNFGGSYRLPFDLDEILSAETTPKVDNQTSFQVT